MILANQLASISVAREPALATTQILSDGHFEIATENEVPHLLCACGREGEHGGEAQVLCGECRAAFSG